MTTMIKIYYADLFKVGNIKQYDKTDQFYSVWQFFLKPLFTPSKKK